MHISFIIVEISKIFGEIGNLVSFIIVGKHKPIRGLAGKGGISGQAWAAQERQMAKSFAAAPVTGTEAAKASIEAAATKKAAGISADDMAVLVATKTCPNCGMAKKMLDKAGISYQVIYADDARGAAFAEQNNILQAPTLLIPDEEGYHKYTNIGEISAFTKKRTLMMA